MSAATPYGVLLISGSHTHQEMYAAAFAADERCRLIGLTDEPNLPARRQELNRRLAEELGVPYLDDLDAALSRDDVHIVCVCADPERRAAIVVRAARSGKHVYVDKPAGTSTEDCAAMCEAVVEGGVNSQMFSLVRLPIARRARRVLESERLGTLIGLHAEVTFAKGIAGTADLSRPRIESAETQRFTWIDSKRELYCVGLYPLVLFEWLTGRRFVSVYGSTANYFFAEHQRNGVEDFASLMLELEGGIESTITVGRTGWSSHPDFGIHKLHLVGTAGTVTLDAFRPRLELASDAEPWRQPATPHPEDPMGFWSSTQVEGGVLPKQQWFAIEQPLQSDASHFVDCIEAGRPSDISIVEGTHAVETILAAYRAAAEKRFVSVG